MEDLKNGANWPNRNTLLSQWARSHRLTAGVGGLVLGLSSIAGIVTVAERLTYHAPLRPGCEFKIPGGLRGGGLFTIAGFAGEVDPQGNLTDFEQQLNAVNPGNPIVDYGALMPGQHYKLPSWYCAAAQQGYPDDVNPLPKFHSDTAP